MLADAPDALINRELSLLDFNRRVLALAENPDVPLLERLRFLSIVGSNVDEFFEIRVAGLKSALRAKIPPTGMTLPDARAELNQITEAAHYLVADQYRVLNQQVLPQLAERGIRLLRNDDRSEAERALVADFFEREVRPLLTPIGLDPAHPFPQIGNKTLNFIVELSGRDAFGRETTIAMFVSRPNASRPDSWTMKFSVLLPICGKGCAGSSPIGVSSGRTSRSKKSATHARSASDRSSLRNSRIPRSASWGSTCWFSTRYWSATR